MQHTLGHPTPDLRLGFGERVDLFESDEPHGFTKPRREAAMRWLRRWLLKLDDAPVEADGPIASDAQLQCTETGQVLSSLHGKSVFDLNAERAAELAARRKEFQKDHDRAELLAQVRRLIPDSVHIFILPPSTAALKERLTKRALDAALQSDMGTMLDLEAAGQAVALTSGEHREAAQAFVQKTGVRYVWPLAADT